MVEPENAVYEFGPFQLDTAKRLLFRDGQLVSASPKLLDTLVILVRHHGQLLEKDELMRLIWPKTVVEESNLAIQVSQLRKLLSEAMGVDPIATVPRRGYRFVAPVRALSAVSPPPVPAAPAAPPREATPAPPPRARRLRWWVAATLLLLMIILSVLWWRTRSAGTAATALLTEKDSILLADVQNETGEPVFDSTLRQALSIQLEQSPFLALVSDQRIQHTLALMKQPAGARLTPEVAWEVCQRTASAAVIYPSLANLGTQYILGVRAVDCRSGNSLSNQQVTVLGKDHVLAAVDQAATALRGRLGESLTQIARYNTPIEQATTASLPALEAYSAGWLLNYGKGDAAGAISFYQRAIQLDPEFAMAYAALGQAYSNLYQRGEAAHYLQRAYALRERVSEREKFYIESRYQRLVTGNLEKARLANAQWSQVYPRDAVPLTSLALIDRYLGQYARAIAEARQAVRLSPDSAQSYANLSFGYLPLNRLEEAKAVAAEAQGKHLDSPLLRLTLYLIAYLQKDRSAEETLEAWSVGQGIEDRFLEHKSLQYAYSGQLGRALELSQRAMGVALRGNAAEIAAGDQAAWAVFEALVGNGRDAARDAAAALALSDDRDTRYASALALALAGETAAAQAAAAPLASGFPEDTAVQLCFLPTIRAVLALQQGEGERSLELLEAARPYEAGSVATLYPAYIRGLVHLARRHPDDALREFQKIIDLPGVVLDDPVGALARLGRARAYAQAGATQRARGAYRDFLALWQDAAPDVPLLGAARQELAALK
jgi:eukaryotic-like serine/threonine-protein kinase